MGYQQTKQVVIFMKVYWRSAELLTVQVLEDFWEVQGFPSVFPSRLEGYMFADPLSLHSPGFLVHEHAQIRVEGNP